MSVDDSHGRHRVGYQASPQWEQAPRHEGRVSNGIFVVKAVRVEFGNGGCGNDNALGKAMLKYIQRQQERRIELWCQAIIGRTRERK